MNWVAVVRNRLLASGAVADLVGERVYGSGVLRTGTPDAPFIMLRLGPMVPRIRVVEATELVVAAHDTAGTYHRVRSALSSARDELSVPLAHPEDGSYPYLRLEWQGRSGELADDQMDTLFQEDSYLVLEARR